MSAGFLVEPGGLDTRAGSLDVVADELSTAATRLPDALGDQPLGAFAQFLVSGLQTAMGQTSAAITHAVSTSDTMSAGLRDAATDYRRTEDGTAATFNKEVTS